MFAEAESGSYDMIIIGSYDPALPMKEKAYSMKSSIQSVAHFFIASKNKGKNVLINENKVSWHIVDIIIKIDFIAHKYWFQKRRNVC